MYHLFFVCIWLKNSIFGEFSNIYLLSAQNRGKWHHKIRPTAKNFRPILIFFARDDAKLMPGEVCQVSCRYSNKWRSYSRKTEGGSDPTPPGGGGLSHQLRSKAEKCIHIHCSSSNLLSFMTLWIRTAFTSQILHIYIYIYIYIYIIRWIRQHVLCCLAFSLYFRGFERCFVDQVLGKTEAHQKKQWM